MYFFGKCIPLRGSYFSAGGEGKSCWFAPVAMSYVFGLETVAPARGISICMLLQAPGAGPDFFCPSFNCLCALRSRVKNPFVHSGSCSSFWAVIWVKLSTGSWRHSFREQRDLSPFPCSLPVPAKNADKMCSSSYFNGLFTWRRRSYQCLHTVLHQEPNEGMKTMFPDMILSHNGLTLLHV